MTDKRVKEFLASWYTEGMPVVVHSAWRNPNVLSGAKVERYMLQQFIGAGGSGVVFAAYQVGVQRKVSVKLLQPLAASDLALIRATERAVRGLTALKDPRLANLLDFGQLRHTTFTSPFLVHEYIEGVQLNVWAQFISRAPDYWNQAVAMSIEIAEALDAAHKCTFIGDLGFQETGILHGDVKPPNILVERATDTPVIIDFMIPEMTTIRQDLQRDNAFWERDENGEYHYHWPVTGMYGTIGYMAPEQERDGIVTPASDVYALGQTLSEVFWQADKGNVPDIHEGENRVASRTSARGCLAEVLAKMTIEQPALRLPTMRHVVAALKDARKVRPVSLKTQATGADAGNEPRLVTRSQRFCDQLVELLEGCRALHDAQARATLVNRLPRPIQVRIDHAPSARRHLSNIVETCARFSYGLSALGSAVRWLEGDTWAARDFESLRTGLLTDSTTESAKTGRFIRLSTVESED